MGATWPMVFAALAGGFIAGALLPADNEPARLNLPGGAVTTPETAADEQSGEGKNADASEGLAAKIPRLQQDKDGKKTASTCRRSTWPYYKHTCFDAAASGDAPVLPIKARRIDPVVAIDLKERKEEKGEEEKGEAEKKETKEEPQTASNDQSAPRGEAKSETEASPVRSASASAEQSSEPEETRASRPQRAERPRTRSRSRQAEAPGHWHGRPARVIILPDGRRIYVYPHAREGRWVAPPPWQRW